MSLGRAKKPFKLRRFLLFPVWLIMAVAGGVYFYEYRNFGGTRELVVTIIGE